MKPFGILLLLFSVIFFFIALIKNRLIEYKFFYFKFSFFVSLFINIGYFINIPFFISYSEIVMIFYLMISLVVGLYERLSFRINKKIMYSTIILIVVLLISLFLLIINYNYPKIIPYSVSADMVYLGKAQLVIPKISKINVFEFTKIVLFLIYILMSRSYFHELKYKNSLINSVFKMYAFISIIYIIEFISNNFINKNFFCDFVNSFFGVYDYRTYTEPLLRNNFYTCKGFYTEPSYITLFIPYFLLVLKRKLISKKDIIIFLTCTVAVVVSGSSSMLAIIPIIIISLFIGANIKFRNKKGLIRLILFMVCFVFISLLVLNNLNIIKPFINYSLTKIQSYLSGDNLSLSGSIRNYGNLICYTSFFTKPFFGLGIGTIKGYGIIPGMLSSLGIFGVIAYLSFICIALNLSLKLKNNILIILIIIGYSFIILSVFYIYMPAILAFILPIKAQNYDKLEAKQNASIIMR